MPPRLDDVVSPELVLVDPGLRARVRATMVVPHWAPSSVPEPPLEPEPVATEPEPRRRMRVAAPVGTLVATAAASLVVSAFSGGEQASGRVAVEWDRSVASAPIASDSAAPGTRAVQGAGVAEGAVSEQARESDATVTFDVLSTPTTSSSPRSVQATATARAPAISSRMLVWPSSTRASAYDVELVRDAAVIFVTRSSAPQAVVPRTWSRAGVAYAVQPEDHVFVWAVVNGRRAATPLVNGVLALDMTRVARLVELSQSTAP